MYLGVLRDQHMQVFGEGVCHRRGGGTDDGHLLLGVQLWFVVGLEGREFVFEHLDVFLELGSNVELLEIDGHA